MFSSLAASFPQAAGRADDHYRWTEALLIPSKVYASSDDPASTILPIVLA